MSRVESPPSLFNTYAGAKMQRLAYLGGVLAEAGPILEDHGAPGGTNERLAEAGRPDLVITNPATMMSITHPLEVTRKCNNFSPNFRMWTGGRETSELNIHSEPKMEPIPATDEEVLALRELPKVGSYEEVQELQNSGQYPAFNVFTHASKPAFIRMLNLFPDFTTILVTEISTPENTHSYALFEADLFVAYQLMSGLVDKSDKYVLNDQGDVEDWYLCK
jgi:hypothetical protein